MFDFLFFIRSRICPNQQVDQKKRYLENLPNELILLLINFLTNKDLMVLSSANHQMLNICLQTRYRELNKVIKNINDCIGKERMAFNKHVEDSSRSRQHHRMWVDPYSNYQETNELGLLKDIHEKEIDKLKRKKNKVICALQTPRP